MKDHSPDWPNEQQESMVAKVAMDTTPKPKKKKSKAHKKKCKISTHQQDETKEGQHENETSQSKSASSKKKRHHKSKKNKSKKRDKQDPSDAAEMQLLGISTTTTAVKNNNNNENVNVSPVPAARSKEITITVGQSEKSAKGPHDSKNPVRFADSLDSMNFSLDPTKNQNKSDHRHQEDCDNTHATHNSMTSRWDDMELGQVSNASNGNKEEPGETGEVEKSSPSFSTHKMFGKQYVYFRHYRLKARWKPRRAFIENVLNKILMVCAAVSVIYPFSMEFNLITGMLGTIQQINMHSWYGFMQHPSFTTRERADLSPEIRQALEKEYEAFERARDDFSFMLHSDHLRRSQKNIDIFAFPIIAPMHFMNWYNYHVHFFVVKKCMFCPKKFATKFASWASAIGVSFFWSYLEMGSTSRVGKVVFSIAVMTQEEYYNSLLFRKSFKEFLKDLFLGILEDYMPYEQFTEAMKTEFNIPENWESFLSRSDSENVSIPNVPDCP